VHYMHHHRKLCASRTAPPRANNLLLHQASFRENAGLNGTWRRKS
jgi:hypothetical protein